MNTPMKDGGPAFPYAFQHEDDTRFIAQGFAPGMCLRDWLAGNCPLSLTESAHAYGMPISEIMQDDDHRQTFFTVDAMVRSEWADAMLAAREKGQQ